MSAARRGPTTIDSRRTKPFVTLTLLLFEGGSDPRMYRNVAPAGDRVKVQGVLGFVRLSTENGRRPIRKVPPQKGRLRSFQKTWVPL